jgi:hypothetical protein
MTNLVARRYMGKRYMMLGVFALFLLGSFSGATAAAESDAPKVSNMRFEGLKIEDNMYVPSSEFGREYKILVDFESQAPIARVLLQTRWADGKVGPVIERPFEVKLDRLFDIIPPSGGKITAPIRGTLMIPSRILKDPRARDTDWWVEDAKGRVSNKLTQQVAIRD